MNADTAEGFEPVVELHASEAHVRSLTILRGGQPGSSSSGGGGGGDNGRRQIQVCNVSSITYQMQLWDHLAFN